MPRDTFECTISTLDVDSTLMKHSWLYLLFSKPLLDSRRQWEETNNPQHIHITYSLSFPSLRNDLGEKQFLLEIVTLYLQKILFSLNLFGFRFTTGFIVPSTGFIFISHFLILNLLVKDFTEVRVCDTLP